jgi:hypothetical protein
MIWIFKSTIHNSSFYVRARNWRGNIGSPVLFAAVSRGQPSPDVILQWEGVSDHKHNHQLSRATDLARSTCSESKGCVDGFGCVIDELYGTAHIHGAAHQLNRQRADIQPEIFASLSISNWQSPLPSRLILRRCMGRMNPQSRIAILQ